nr:hypothetical protein [Tanacetum cinerariifolium]
MKPSLLTLDLARPNHPPSALRNLLWLQGFWVLVYQVGFTRSSWGFFTDFVLLDSSSSNGATLPRREVVEGATTVMTIITVKEKAQRRLKVNARCTLMMGIPNKHQLKFSSIKDAKQLLEAVEKRFGRNATTKKTQRNLLKQQYEKFSNSRNKAGLDTMSMDDLYKSLKVYELEVKGMSGSSSSTQNMAFVSSSNNNSSSTNRVVITAQAVNTGHRVSIASTQVTAVNIDNLSDAVSCDGLGGYDWSDQAEEGLNYALMAFTSTSSDSKIVDNCKKGLGYESYNAVPLPYTGNFMPPKPDLSFTGLDEFVNKPKPVVAQSNDFSVSPIPTTRIHKDHPLKQVIGDLYLAPQTRRMTKNLEEHGLVGTVIPRTDHKDLQNCLFTCFISQMEPKKVLQALKDPSWIEAMQEERLQFKLQDVWTLVDLPQGKRAIGSK